MSLAGGKAQPWEVCSRQTGQALSWRRRERLIHVESWWETGTCSPSRGKPREGSQWSRWEQGGCEGPGWFWWLMTDGRWIVQDVFGGRAHRT